MGQYDSSRTRVAPVFDWLQASDPTGQSWLPPLLRLAAAQELVLPPQSDLLKACWRPAEKALAPPRSLLRWLVKNLEEPAGGQWGGAATRVKRELLVAKDVTAVREALDLLSTQSVDTGWHVLEGSSRPDVFLATEDAVVVIEGKRTERMPTTTTTWMKTRHQMLRHLDGALEILGDRNLYGFFIVEGAGTSVPEEWARYARATVSEDTIAGSLPHRTEAERCRIKQAFLGVTTWQSLCERMGVPERVLAGR